MNSKVLLLLTLALSFHLLSGIWAHEIDIFRSWRLINGQDFHAVQRAHWRKLPYWIFVPMGLALAASIALIWHHPSGSPAWLIWSNIGCQVTSLALTAIFWGRWQGMLVQDDRGPQSPYLTRILATHWIRTLLVNASGFVVLIWAIDVLAR